MDKRSVPSFEGAGDRQGEEKKRIYIGRAFGGGGTLGGGAGNYPTNPVSGAVNESPIGAGPTTTAALMALRGNSPSVHGNPGRHTYSVIDTGRSYSVVGIDANGFTIAGVNGKVLALSNQ